MSNLFTASEAYRVASCNNKDQEVVLEILKDILYNVIYRAEQGQYRTKCYFRGFGSIKPDYIGKVNENQKAVISRLRDLGYQANLVVLSNKRGMIDSFLEVKW